MIGWIFGAIGALAFTVAVFGFWRAYQAYRAAKFFAGLTIALAVLTLPAPPAHALSCADVRHAVLTLTPEEVANMLRGATLPQVSQVVVCLRAELQRGAAK